VPSVAGGEANEVPTVLSASTKLLPNWLRLAAMPCPTELRWGIETVEEPGTFGADEGEVPAAVAIVGVPTNDGVTLAVGVDAD
jgi:hypothetical protein